MALTFTEVCFHIRLFPFTLTWNEYWSIPKGINYKPFWFVYKFQRSQHTYLTFETFFHYSVFIKKSLKALQRFYLLSLSVSPWISSPNVLYMYPLVRKYQFCLLTWKMVMIRADVRIGVTSLTLMLILSGTLSKLAKSSIMFF